MTRTCKDLRGKFYQTWKNRGNSPVYHLIDFPSVRVTVGRADVNDADEIFHAPTEIQYTICALCVQIDGYLERLVKAHGGRTVKYNVDSLYQHVPVLGSETQFRHTHVSLNGGNLVQDTREIPSNPVEDLRREERVRMLLEVLLLFLAVLSLRLGYS